MGPEHEENLRSALVDCDSQAQSRDDRDHDLADQSIVRLYLAPSHGFCHDGDGDRDDVHAPNSAVRVLYRFGHVRSSVRAVVPKNVHRALCRHRHVRSPVHAVPVRARLGRVVGPCVVVEDRVDLDARLEDGHGFQSPRHDDDLPADDHRVDQVADDAFPA